MTYNPHMTFTTREIKERIVALIRHYRGIEVADPLSTVLHELNVKVQYYAFQALPDTVRPLRTFAYNQTIAAGWGGGLDLGTLTGGACLNLLGVGNATRHFNPLTPQQFTHASNYGAGTADNPCFLWGADNKLYVFNGTSTDVTGLWIDYIREPKEMVETITDTDHQTDEIEIGNQWVQILIYHIAADLFESNSDDSEAQQARQAWINTYQMMWQNMERGIVVAQTGKPGLSTMGKSSLHTPT